jgi:Leucine-rich repeat (LRR) protein
MVLSGVVSAATVQECGNNNLTLFTNVPKFVDWIHNEMINSNDNEALDSVFNAFDQNPYDELNANIIDVDCNYTFTGEAYVCYVSNLETPDTDINVSFRGGQHRSQRSNRDVQTVQMIGGKVTHFPQMTNLVEAFPNLNGLGVTFTKLMHIDRSKVSNLGQLKFLLIADNDIEDIPADTFLDLKNLEWIDICRNKVNKLDSSWTKSMPNLRVFKARSNKFAFVPANMFDSNPQLEEVLLDFNQIARVEVNFNHLKNLKIMRILGNACINMEYCLDDKNSNCVRSLQKFSFLVSGYCGNFS